MLQQQGQLVGCMIPCFPGRAMSLLWCRNYNLVMELFAPSLFSRTGLMTYLSGCQLCLDNLECVGLLPRPLVDHLHDVR